MKRFVLPILVLVVFMFESIFVNFVAMASPWRDWILSPHFVVVVLAFMSVYYHPKQAMLYGVILGFMYDIAFTDVLGVYALGLPAVCYIVSKLMKIFQQNTLIVICMSLLAVAIIEFYVYGINSIINISDMTIGRFLQERFYATIILNAMFALIFAFPLQRCFQYFAKFIDER
ncbi:rod shape-determining protein MreD [Priestia megaterium]|uniref:rod shape-determining protein MreD n=1 Tax=Priestia megaterium TaxID=1404 RepID=UPI001C221708|nr:rod shape-determining protein MreD [Priestia megaterium]MBU8690133.1 rod shape-determining protein MreD [Priestia megaterium]